MHLRVFVYASVLVGLGVNAEAQLRSESVLKRGDRIRYVLPGGEQPFTGRIEVVEMDGLLVRPDGMVQSVPLGFDSLRAIAVSSGGRSSGDGALSGALAGLRLGALIGAIATTAVWLSPADERCDGCVFPPTVGAGVLSVVGTAFFTVLGAVLGASAPGEQWTEIPRSAWRRRGS